MARIFTIKHFLKIFRILLPVLNVMFLLPAAFSQDTYTLQLSDTLTYENNGCGKINSATWTVRDDSCVLYTPFFRKESEGITIVSYNFITNQDGSGDYEDVAYVQVQRNNGEWVTDTLLHSVYIHPPQVTSFNLTGSFSMVYGETIRLRVILITDENNDFWSIFSGSTVTGSFETYPDYPGFLPVELAFFSGSYVDKSIVLKWATFSETNCDFYDILRSHDGGKFKQIAFIDGAGNSNQYLTYAYADEEKISGKIAYYMLRQVDMDGEDEVFGPIAVVLKHPKLSVSVFPNPVGTFSTIKLSFPGDLTALSIVKVFDSSGNEIINKIVESNDFAFSLDKPGLYIVAVTNNGVVTTEKLAVK